jgi:hypothetical protein
MLPSLGCDAVTRPYTHWVLQLNMLCHKALREGWTPTLLRFLEAILLLGLLESRVLQAVQLPPITDFTGNLSRGAYTTFFDGCLSEGCGCGVPPGKRIHTSTLACVRGNLDWLTKLCASSVTLLLLPLISLTFRYNRKMSSCCRAQKACSQG